MTDIAGIQQSVSRAWQLLNQTGFMDMSRGLYTEAYQRNVSEAMRELREASRSLVADGNRGAYGELNSNMRVMLWKSILRARAPATGIFIISRLGAQYRGMAEDVRTADNLMSSLANGFPVRELHHMTSRILNASPDPRTALEQEAARSGDPMPPGISTQEAELYQRIMLRAIQQSSREASAYRNAGEAAFDAFGQSFLPPLPDSADGMRAFGQDQVEGALASAVSRGGETVARESAQSIGAIVSLIRAISDAADAHYRANNPEYRLNHWVHQGCLAESGGNGPAAVSLMERLQNIRQRMNAWLEWLQRHQDHPSYVPPSGRLDPAPTASLSPNPSGTANRTGSVMGSMRGPSGRSSIGLA